MKWERIRTSFAIKASALVLSMVVLVITAASAGVVVFNVEEGTYSKTPAQITEKLYDQVACEISSDILGEINSGADLSNSTTGGIYVNIDPLQEGFGYMVTQLNKNGKEKILEKVMDQRLKDAIHRIFLHENTRKGDIRLDIYFSIEDMLKKGNGAYTDNYIILQKFYTFRYSAIGIMIVGLLVFIALVIALLCAAGWTREGLKANVIDKIPLDLLCVFAVFSWFMALTILNDGYYDVSETASEIIMIDGMFFLLSAVWMGILCMTFATRLKLGKWWKNTICYLVWKLLKQIVKTIVRTLKAIELASPLVLKAGVATGAICLVWMFCIAGAASAMWSGQFIVYGFIFSILLVLGSLYFALGLQKIKTAGEKLAAGELNYHIDKKGLYLDFANHAEHLNQIGDGMSHAVEERMKSERFKTELITNVSHDIKTPLTSIINYVDLLKKEEIKEVKLKEYIDVLDRQSYRLKKLLEDLINASKAATGAVKLDIAPCQVGILMMQTLGEYEERLQEQELKIVTSIPDEDITIMADGRQLWRVFDNLLANICKYSQPHTRVYIDLYKEDGVISIVYKNISKYEIDIKGEAFLERFVRGDRSRHTEGSGLGLSIAQSLINLQGGTLEVVIDGDLFKVVIRFKQ